MVWVGGVSYFQVLPPPNSPPYILEARHNTRCLHNLEVILGMLGTLSHNALIWEQNSKDLKLIFHRVFSKTSASQPNILMSLMGDTGMCGNPSLSWKVPSHPPPTHHSSLAILFRYSNLFYFTSSPLETQINLHQSPFYLHNSFPMRQIRFESVWLAQVMQQASIAEWGIQIWVSQVLV